VFYVAFVPFLVAFLPTISFIVIMCYRLAHKLSIVDNVTHRRPISGRLANSRFLWV